MALSFPSNPTSGQVAAVNGRQYTWNGSNAWELYNNTAVHGTTHQTGGTDPIANVVSSPTQITANQNDYSLTGADIYRISSDAARTITGIVAGSSGALILLVNVGSFNITLSHQSASSTAANRIITLWTGDMVLAASAAVSLFYDGTTSRWRVL